MTQNYLNIIEFSLFQDKASNNTGTFAIPFCTTFVICKKNFGLGAVSETNWKLVGDSHVCSEKM